MNENNSMSALESIVKTLEISESQRADLIAVLRKLKLFDDNDPIVKMTLAIGLMTKLTSEIPERLKAERLASLQEYRALTAVNNEKLSGIAEFLKTLEANWQDSYELWVAKKEGVEKEFASFSKDFEKYQNCLEELISKAESIRRELCFVSFGNIMTAVTTTLGIIIILKFLRWL